jgi:hypothetical protein
VGEGCTSTNLDPILVDAMVNQGLDYSTLVRGKSAIARFYLSLPSCASPSQTIQVTSATLASESGSISLGQSLAPIDSLTTDLKAAPQVDPYHADATLAKKLASNQTGSNPRFAVPASYLSPAFGSQGFTATFTATVTYTYDTNGPSSNGGTGSRSKTVEVSAPVHGTTNSLRILTVAMGDPTLGFAGAENLTAGLGALARLFPVPDGHGNIDDGSSGGIRYTPSAGTMDMRPFMAIEPDGKFCGSLLNAHVVSSLLSARLDQHNSANGSSLTADRVLGAIDTASSRAGGICAEGMATYGGRDSWVRTPDGYTGATLGMESAHNSGAVTEEREDPNDITHSPNIQIDAGRNRAYNLDTKSFLANDATVMSFQGGDVSTNGSTGLEKHDWEQAFCRLGGPITEECKDSRLEGVSSSPSVPHSEQIAVTGITDGTPEVADDGEHWLPTAQGTLILDGHVGRLPATSEPAASDYHFVQRGNGGTTLSDRLVDVHEVHSVHGDHEHAGVGIFNFAYAVSNGARGWELWKGTPGSGTLLASRSLIDAPEVTSPVFEGPVQTADFDAWTPLSTEIAEGVTFNAESRVIADPTAPSLPNALLNAAGVDDATPLTATFDESAFEVSLRAGNGSVGTVALLEALDADGEVVATDEAQLSVPKLFESDALTVRSESGSIRSIRLTYSQTNDLPTPHEEMDDLSYTTEADQGLVTGHAAATTSGDPRNLRGHFFAQCPSVSATHNVPVATALRPYLIDDAEGKAFFRFTWDSGRSCEQNGVITSVFRATDGFSSSSFSAHGTLEVPENAPVAAILSPVIDGAILEHQQLILSGAAQDATDGVLPGSALSWYLSGPAFSGETFAGSGTSLSVAPPNGFDWPTGAYTVRLVATDSEGNSAEVSAPTEILIDEDNDGIAFNEETCYAGPGDLTPDQNPYNAHRDADADGIVNVDDVQPCVEATAYGFLGDFDPNTLFVPSSGHPVTFFVKASERDLQDVIADSVRIGWVSGYDVPVSVGDAVNWQVDSSGVGTAKVSRPALTSWLLDPNGDGDTSDELVGRFIEMRLTGSGLTGATEWTFEAQDVTHSKPAN